MAQVTPAYKLDLHGLNTVVSGEIDFLMDNRRFFRFRFEVFPEGDKLDLLCAYSLEQVA